METRASYILVGSFVLVLAAAALAFILWLSKADFEDAPDNYVVYFTGSVTGLAVGSPVRFRGVPVGTVIDIRIDRENVERIKVTLEAARGTPIKEDTVATLRVLGITGVAYVLLVGGTQDSPALKPLPDQDVAVIQSRPSGLEQVLESAPALFERAVALVDRLNLLVDNRNIGAIAETLDNFRKLSETLASRAKQLDGLLEEGTQTMTALRGASDNFNAISEILRGRAGPLSDNADRTMKDVRRALVDVRSAANSISTFADELDTLVEENRRPLRDFSSGGLYELSLFIAEARVLVSGLTRLSAQIERDPARFFFGDTQKGFEAR